MGDAWVVVDGGVMLEFSGRIDRVAGRGARRRFGRRAGLAEAVPPTAVSMARARVPPAPAFRAVRLARSRVAVRAVGHPR